MKARLQMARTYLIDLDGTLIESSPLHARSFETALAVHAPAMLENFDYHPLRGMTTEDALLHLGMPRGPLLEATLREKQAAYRDALAQGLLQIHDGATALLDLLRARGRAVYVVTGGSPISAGRALEASSLMARIDGLVAAAPGLAGKPSPELYLTCMQRFGIDAAEAMAVEDADSGVEAACAAGLAVVHVNTAAVHPRALCGYGTLRQFYAAVEEALR